MWSYNQTCFNLLLPWLHPASQSCSCIIQLWNVNYQNETLGSQFSDDAKPKSFGLLSAGSVQSELMAILRNFLRWFQQTTLKSFSPNIFISSTRNKNCYLKARLLLKCNSWNSLLNFVCGLYLNPTSDRTCVFRLKKTLDIHEKCPGLKSLARNKEIEKFAEHSKFQFIQWSSDKPTTFPFIFFIFWVLNWVWKKKTGKLLRKTFFGFCACLWLEVEWNKNFYEDLSKLWWKFDKVSLRK